MRMRRKKNLVPRMERCAQWLISDPQALRGNWRSLLPGAKELRIELGCGKAASPARRPPPRRRSCLWRWSGCRTPWSWPWNGPGTWSCTMSSLLTPTRPICRRFCPGMRWTSSTLTSATPGPPKRHAKRRLTHRDFLLRYRQVLRAGGEIHFKTDNVGLFAFSVTEFPLGGFYPEQMTHDSMPRASRGL